jgi:hypothetical protein
VFSHLSFRYVFNASLQVDGIEHPLDCKNAVWRGSTLRNTKWVVGVVIYTGQFFSKDSSISIESYYVYIVVVDLFCILNARS